MKGVAWKRGGQEGEREQGAGQEERRMRGSREEDMRMRGSREEDEGEQRGGWGEAERRTGG